MLLFVVISDEYASEVVGKSLKVTCVEGTDVMSLQHKRRIVRPDEVWRATAQRLT